MSDIEFKVIQNNLPDNYGPLKNFNGHGRITGPCGDTMEFWLWINEGKIAEAKFITDGCGSSIASGSMAARLSEGKDPYGASRIGQIDVLEAIGGLPEESAHCALLATNTLKSAIEDFQKKGNRDEYS